MSNTTRNVQRILADTPQLIAAHRTRENGTRITCFYAITPYDEHQYLCCAFTSAEAIDVACGLSQAWQLGYQTGRKDTP